ncbi:hypothetical protein HAX54_014563, partial [Datura stramonium]|nr:hypothetical protein [Datura stramonium]
IVGLFFEMENAKRAYSQARDFVILVRTSSRTTIGMRQATPSQLSSGVPVEGLASTAPPSPAHEAWGSSCTLPPRLRVIPRKPKD